MPQLTTFALTPVPNAAAQARRRVRELLADVPVVDLRDVELAVSELVTNAVRHGEGTVHVDVWRLDDRVRLQVGDAGRGAADVRPRTPDQTGGWGLRIVDAVSIRWGVHEGSTHVWCEIPL